MTTKKPSGYTPADLDRPGRTRRRVLKSIAAGTGAAAVGANLPERWGRPLIDAAVLPAHAQATLPLTVAIVELQSDDTSDTPATQGPYGEGTHVPTIGDASNDDLDLNQITATTSPGVEVDLTINASVPIGPGLSFDAIAAPTDGIATFPNLVIQGDSQELQTGDFMQLTFTAGAQQAIIRFDFTIT
jgi:hypothetical protein